MKPRAASSDPASTSVAIGTPVLAKRVTLVVVNRWGVGTTWVWVHTGVANVCVHEDGPLIEYPAAALAVTVIFVPALTTYVPAPTVDPLTL